MAKRGYTCACGQFRLGRGDKTRKQYAAAKEQHAKECEIMKEELKANYRVTPTAPARGASGLPGREE